MTLAVISTPSTKRHPTDIIDAWCTGGASWSAADRWANFQCQNVIDFECPQHVTSKTVAHAHRSLRMYPALLFRSLHERQASKFVYRSCVLKFAAKPLHNACLSKKWETKRMGGNIFVLQVILTQLNSTYHTATMGIYSSCKMHHQDVKLCVRMKA